MFRFLVENVEYFEKIRAVGVGVGDPTAFRVNDLDFLRVRPETDDTVAEILIHNENAVELMEPKRLHHRCTMRTDIDAKVTTHRANHVLIGTVVDIGIPHTAVWGALGTTDPGRMHFVDRQVQVVVSGVVAKKSFHRRGAA